MTRNDDPQPPPLPTDRPVGSRWLLAVLVAALLIGAPWAPTGGAWASSAGKESSDEDEIGPLFIDLGTVNISVVHRARVRGLLSVGIQIEVSSLKRSQRTRKMRPRLYNAFYRVLSIYADSALRPGRPLHVEYIRKLLQREADRILGAKEAQILITNALFKKS